MSNVAEAIALNERIEPLLKGKHPAVQGAVLAQLLATYLKGHQEEAREQLLQLHMTTVRRMVEAMS